MTVRRAGGWRAVVCARQCGRRAAAQAGPGRTEGAGWFRSAQSQEGDTE